MKTVPLIENVEVNLIAFEEEEKVWELYFTIRDDGNHYSMWACLDDDWTFEQFYGYEKQSSESPDEIYLVEGVEEPNWVSHVFYQCVMIIKRHSKYWNALLHFSSIHPGHKFKALEHYQKPNNITLNE